MPLPTPNLDDRRFQDLVNEAKRRIPQYCPEWTDHNVSDPGVMLIELFAWMVESLIYRLNRVPEKSFITFLDLMGVRLQPPAAARTALTFWLAGPTTETGTIPADTEVATVQTATEHAISFSTDADLIIRPPERRACVTATDEQLFSRPVENQRFTDVTSRLDLSSEHFLAFSVPPQPGDAFYLCDGQDLSGNILALRIDCTTEALGIDPDAPPLSWEAWCNEQWVPVEVERDETKGLNKRGEVVLHLPRHMTMYDLQELQGYWVRCCYRLRKHDQARYDKPPKIATITATTIGGWMDATQSVPIPSELLGRSNGKPGQTFRLEYPPVLPRRTGETLQVQAEDGTWHDWEEREHFGDSQPEDKHFTLDSITGDIGFGPAIRQPDGRELQYGAIPPCDCRIRFQRYRSGGGIIGNVGTDTVTILKHSIPRVDRVTNRKPATGGRDAEKIERASMRAPSLLRHSFRAVTAEDFENLAVEASGGVARARCLQPRAVGAAGAPPPGVVQLFLVPAVPSCAEHTDRDCEERIERTQLQPARGLIDEVAGFLDERRLLTTEVQIGAPEYRWVAVHARIKARPEADHDQIQREACKRLYRFLNPLVGGHDGTGWPFGQALYLSQVYAILQGLPGVQYIEQATLNLLMDGGKTPQQQIVLPPHGLIASDEHELDIV